MNTDTEYLYSKGVYPTKITENDLSEDYIKIRSRSIWYMDGWVKTSGVKSVDFTYMDENHLLKDDYLYISYDSIITREANDYYSKPQPVNYYMAISGGDIIKLIHGIEKYSPECDTKKVRELVYEKMRLFREHYPEDWKRIFGTDEYVDVFEVFA